MKNQSICIAFCLFLITNLKAQNSCYSLRFNDDNPSRLSKTFSSPPVNKKQQTYSFWLKRGNLTDGYILGGWDGSSPNANMIGFISNHLYLSLGITSTPLMECTSVQVFTDPAAWYHVVIAINMNELLSSDRLKVWVNGAEITDWITGVNLLSEDVQFLLNNGFNRVGSHYNDSYPFDGYMYDFYAVDGETLTASSFGQFNPVSGEWEPIPYTGV